MVSVLEHCRIAPPHSTVSKTSLPLTYLDLFLFNFAPVQHLLFLDFPDSKTHFLEKVIPNLKHSLSIALQHFFPLAGKLIIPIDKSTKPEIRYEEGYGVSLTIAESEKDFNHLAGDHPRNASGFYDLLPQIPEVTKVFDEVDDKSQVANAIPVLAIQVTLFPEFGVCIGLTYEHKAIDGRSFLHFVRSWADLSGRGLCTSLPSYDRSVLHDPDDRLANIFWNQSFEYSLDDQMKLKEHLLSNRVRATFVLSGADVQRLKNLVLTRRPTISRVSTFVVVCAYSWVCKVKSRGDVFEKDETEYFGFVVDCRGGRTDPPIPENYFGNCLTACLAEAKHHSVLVGEEGFLMAAELIGEVIGKMRKIRTQEGLMEGKETFFSERLASLNWERVLTVAGSPKMPVYDLDFGFGKLKKREIVSIDGTGAISLTESRNSKGGVEIGLSLPIDQMKSFSHMFVHHQKINKI